ncbi:MAG: cardiolipin synthase B [Leptolyngbyaceae cyanobacterium SM1_1_3]|nr:cardiolipin synthase B [Leptolyngbyaceae cyanobacterium SM1_1_3]NJN04268.1 cardiolipin synthase B [Leptolyngbyaceae cyanobacterium RM1_1_2]NJO11611.1 cardiolipin synthase B [Leptolyngbyaceae cyanobacterium SL_1_1]
MIVSILLSTAVFIFIAVLLVLYFRGAFRRQPDYSLQRVPSPTADHFMAAIAGLSDSIELPGQITHFWSDIATVQAERLKAIKSAQRSIQFETYIMTPGQRADDFAEALIQQSTNGVSIQLVIDSFGARSLPKRYWQKLRSAGVEVRFFNAFSWRSPTDFLARNHRKLLLVDQSQALIGGAGVSDMWDGVGEGETAPWLDTEVCIKGPVLTRLRGLFLQHWLDAGESADLSGVDWQAKTTAADETLLVTSGKDPSYRGSSIRALMQLYALSASQRLWIASPYLLPDRNTRKVLIKAAQRGIDVRILTMGSLSDKPYVYYASRELYGELLRSGIKIYEYQPSMMHAKLVLIDQDWISLGSANLDPRSFFHNDELNLSAAKSVLVSQLEQLFHQAFLKSQPVELTAWRSRSLWQKLYGRCSLLLYWQL